MIVNITEKELTYEWIVENLPSLIENHTANRATIDLLIKYQNGMHPILNRMMSNEYVPNNKLVNNFPRYITTVSVGYFMGNPISYQATDTSKSEEVEKFKDILKKVDIESVDVDLSTNCSITGVGYELIKTFVTDNGEVLPKSYSLDARNTFVVVDNTVESNPLFGVYYQEINSNYGRTLNTRIMVATKDTMYEFIYEKDKVKMIDATPHYFNIVPIIQYKNNLGLRGDYQDVLTLIDAYNMLQSDRINDKEQLIDAILMLKNVSLEDSETVNNIRENRILVLPADGDGKWLTKQLQEADVEILRKNLENDIHKFSLTPNITDEQFSGNASGVAMQYKLFGFEQLIKTKERFYQEGLRRRIKAYLNFLTKKNLIKDIKLQDIDYVFNRNLPTNNIEIAQMVSQLKNILSDETLISQVPFVKDVKVELNRLEEQDKKKNDNIQKSFGFPKVGDDDVMDKANDGGGTEETDRIPPKSN